MITVAYSTREHNPEFIEYLKKSSGFKKLEVIENKILEYENSKKVETVSPKIEKEEKEKTVRITVERGLSGSIESLTVIKG